MRRILKTSKMIPHKRRIEMEATFAGSSKPRGRPRKVTENEAKKGRGRPVKVEDEKENSSKKSVIERPGRRTVKRPKRYDGEGEELKLFLALIILTEISLELSL